MLILRNAFLLLVALGTSPVHADQIDSNGILRSDDGHQLYVTHNVAMNACPVGMRLPTAREFANESQARGAEGILEADQVDPENPPKYYYKVSALNSDGSPDDFYFNFYGYGKPEGNLDLTRMFWSSSVDSTRNDFAIGFSAYYGDVDASLSSRYFAVRCISK